MHGERRKDYIFYLRKTGNMTTLDCTSIFTRQLEIPLNMLSITKVKRNWKLATIYKNQSKKTHKVQAHWERD